MLDQPFTTIFHTQVLSSLDNVGLQHTNLRCNKVRIKKSLLFVCCRDVSWLFAVSLKFS